MKIGSDLLSGLCTKTAGFSIAHGFAHRLSAGAETHIYLNKILKRQDEIVVEHRNNLSIQDRNTSVKDIDSPFQEICLYVDIWPKSVFNGAFIRFGGRIQDNGEPDMTIGVGYMMNLWKGLGIETWYNLGMMEVINKQKLSTDSIKAGFYYVF